ncbi:TrlF family AAA-like ATPase [Spirosoma validum]|uniref:AAA family ATPase n=1 Tax=Spirosoma validum TaxID=2771355 RepID=A0A927B518_9BACT|nr:AAA family ATPase [Spirosoma validum]MBD2755766.1 AAA family ATPase [Spirosoma validum]
MFDLYKGSEWNKWDLHIHTPLSIEQHYGGDNDSSWSKFVKDLEALDSSFKVLGINDYFTINGYKKLLDLQHNNGILPGRVLLPVIELRIRSFANLNSGDPWKRVNVHIIFNNKDTDSIETQFLNLLPFEFDGFKRTGLSETTITNFGQFIINKTPSIKQNNLSPLKQGFNNINFDFREICRILEESELEYFIAVGKTEWETLKWDGSAAEKLEIIKRSDFLFTSSIDEKAYEKSRERLCEQLLYSNIPPLLDCSDAHAFSNSLDSNNLPIKDRIGNCFSWIKADCTFEGLKQICFESDSRLSISNYKPVSPVRKINSLKLNFPNNTKIAKKGIKIKGKESLFCFRNNTDIAFSPYFTCLIGGRGTGKSTILSLIAAKLGSNSPFIENSVLLQDNKQIELDKYVSIDTSSNDIEFVSQNQIESFAESNDLTEAIYSRLIQISDYNEFEVLENDFAVFYKRIDQQIHDINLRFSQLQDLNKLRKEHEDCKRIISSYDSPDYKNITQEIREYSEQIQNILNSRDKYTKLVLFLKDSINRFSVNNNIINQYDTETARILIGVEYLLNEEIKFDSDLSNEEVLNRQLLSKKKELDSYLKLQGVSEADISDYERSVTNLPVIEAKIKNLIKSGKETAVRISEFKENLSSYGFEKRKIFEEKIINSLNPMNEQLKSSDSNVADIKFTYEFDEEQARNYLLDEFELHFKDYKPSQHSTKTDAVREYLLCIDPLDVDNYEDYMSALEEKGTSINAKTLLKALFEKKENFEIYKLLIKRVYSDVKQHKKIIGYYGGKELENCSFGQRCTAVIVALLMFGNKPLLIDEPEAHLDSKLVAEYLVNLIKKRKHERQIIFATHNANFVVNGDAELIHILEVLEDNTTSITSISIENLIHRDKLLTLEGGRTAFEIRDKKLIRK